MYRAFRFLLLACAAGATLPCVLWAAEPPAGDVASSERSPAEPFWHTDYAEAMRVAKQQGKMMFVFFCPPGKNLLRDHFESKILTDAVVGGKLQDYVCAKLPLSVKIRVRDEEVTVLRHAAFRDMRGRQGVAILDFAHQEASYYGRVVSAFPFTQSHCYSARQMAVIFDLPPGTAGQRRRVFSARAKWNKSAADEESSTAEREPPRAQAESPSEIRWHIDYAQAMDDAKRQGKMLFIYFCDPGKDQPCNRFKAETLDAPMVRKRLNDYVCAQLPLDAKIVIQGKPTALLAHAAFAEMLGRPGAAIVDFAHQDAGQYGYVVSTFPITGKLWYTAEQMAVILDLPPGTLTQRTLIYAVRIHPERPASTSGQIAPSLLLEAESHSRHQARIRLQGHHGWETRFHRITAGLPGGLTAREVCAESWPGENLVEAAIECVRCWRSSSGHWSAVRAPHRFYGYDMKRGPDGVWYATGIFGSG